MKLASSEKHSADIELSALLGHLPAEKLNAICLNYGIAGEFIEFSGNVAKIAPENRIHMLNKLGVRFENERQLDSLLDKKKQQELNRWLPQTLVVYPHQRDFIINVKSDKLNKSLLWKLNREDGSQESGSVVPEQLKCIEQYAYNGVCYEKRVLELNTLPLGYHHLLLSDGGKWNSSLLISTPHSTFQPNWLQEGRRTAGVSAQLYTIRSEQNWGIGDFSDLKDLVEKAADNGLDFVLVNPLHALDSLYPENASPYSPSDRRFLNPLYIAPTWCEEFSNTLLSMDIAAQLSALRKVPDVDYINVSVVKYALFDKLYQKFKKEHLLRLTERGKLFKNYVKSGGESLLAFARFQAQRKIPGIKSSIEQDFFLYLQWQACSQLQYCQEYAQQLKMSIGLIRDLAVGSSIDGCEVSTNEALFCMEARIGAPPDNFNPDGQNWGLPPLRPDILENSGFEHFINLLRSNMRSCGALRIDHVMSMMRLWWCPNDGSNASGAYVYYPVEAMFAIMRLESYRAECLVIGEDLGVVPPEIIPYLEDSGIVSNIIFYFEKYDAEHFKKPADYKTHALAMITNHDVPTLKGWWQKSDLILRRKIGLLQNDESLEIENRQRDMEKNQLLGWLADLNLLPDSWQHSDGNKNYDMCLAAAITAACSRAPTRLLSIQLDDLAEVETPVNIPGTSTEYSNWSRKLPMDLNTVFSSDGAINMLAALNTRHAL